MLLDSLQCPRQPPPQRIICSKMPIVLMKRNLESGHQMRLGSVCGGVRSRLRCGQTHRRSNSTDVLSNQQNCQILKFNS